MESRINWIVELSPNQIQSLKEHSDLMQELSDCSHFSFWQSENELLSQAQSQILLSAASVLKNVLDAENERVDAVAEEILDSRQMEKLQDYKNKEQASYLNRRKKLDAQAFTSLAQALLRISDAGTD